MKALEKKMKDDENEYDDADEYIVEYDYEGHEKEERNECVKKMMEDENENNDHIEQQTMECEKEGQKKEDKNDDQENYQTEESMEKKQEEERRTREEKLKEYDEKKDEEDEEDDEANDCEYQDWENEDWYVEETDEEEDENDDVEIMEEECMDEKKYQNEERLDERIEEDDENEWDKKLEKVEEREDCEEVVEVEKVTKWEDQEWKEKDWYEEETDVDYDDNEEVEDMEEEGSDENNYLYMEQILKDEYVVEYEDEAKKMIDKVNVKQNEGDDKHISKINTEAKNIAKVNKNTSNEVEILMTDEKSKHTKIKQSKPDATVCYIPDNQTKHYITTTEHDLKTLNPGKQLNDIIVDGQIKIGNIKENLNNVIRNMITFDSFLFKRLEYNNDVDIYSVQLANAHMFLIPVCYKHHWILLVFNKINGKLYILDSLQSYKYKRVQVSFQAAKIVKKYLDNQLNINVILVKVNVLQQGDTLDCGVYMIQNIETLKHLGLKLAINALEQRDFTTVIQWLGAVQKRIDIIQTLQEIGQKQIKCSVFHDEDNDEDDGDEVTVVEDKTNMNTSVQWLGDDQQRTDIIQTLQEIGQKQIKYSVFQNEDNGEDDGDEVNVVEVKTNTNTSVHFPAITPTLTTGTTAASVPTSAPTPAPSFASAPIVKRKMSDKLSADIAAVKRIKKWLESKHSTKLVNNCPTCQCDVKCNIAENI